MKKKVWIWMVAIIATLAVVYVVISLVLNQGQSQTDVTKFSPYISGYTSGVISKTSSIKIQLTSKFAKSLGPVDERETDLFEFTPDIDGSAGWLDFRTIQFVPDEPLQSDKTYYVKFELVTLNHDLDRDLRVFKYELQTKPQNFSVDVTEIITTDREHLKWQEVHGVIRTADSEKTENIEKLLEARHGDNDLNVRVMQSGENRFEFIVDSVPRTEESGRLKIAYNGDAIDVDKTGSLEVSVPSLSEFTILDVDVVQAPDQYVKIQFSDPIMENQYLDGLIQLTDESLLNYTVENNLIKVYPPERIEGKRLLKVNPGIKNILGFEFREDFHKNLDFEEIAPAVRMTGKGTIMPKADGKLVLPFEAVNLRAVDVRISKIFENNILQFLQVNDLDDDYQLRRVSKVIKTKTVRLDQTSITDLGKWNRYTLDLNELINTDPGAIYRVDIGFRQKHSIYPCDEENEDGQNLTTTTKDSEEKEFWDNFTRYSYDSGYGNWEHRNDPCHPAYYGFRKAVSRNVFASDMGIIGKKGQDGSCMVVVTDLISAKPLKGITVDLYNYQQQLVVSKATNTDGVVAFDPQEEEKIYFAVASRDNDKAYLKMDDGKSLSVSDFDVGGTDVSDGLKGFIYTERGVRRPGDSVYIGFILEDMRESLPEGHPVIFEMYDSRSRLVDKQVQNLNELKFHVFRSRTEPDAPTGNYSVRINLGGKTFYHSLPVETVKPNRLKIDYSLQDGTLYAEKSNPISIWVKWLHGAPGKNLKTTVSMSLYPMKTNFDGYDSYHFDNLNSTFSFNTTEVIDETTNSEGHITGDIKTGALNNAPGKLMAKLTFKAFEKGGNFSIMEKQVPCHPFDTYVGMKLPASSRSYGNYLPTEKNHTVDLVTVNTDGGKVSESHKLQVELLKSEWSWWYYSYNNSTNYTSSDHVDLIKREVIRTQDGAADWDFEVDRDNWGYYILRVTDLESGHTTAQRIYADWPEYAGIGRGQAKSASILRFKAEKDTFNVDEEVKIKLPGSEDGRAFISIENGSRVLEHYWLETEKGETEFTFLASDEMSPNVYIHISLIQPHEQTENDRPIRMYGVIPVRIENKETHLKPVIDMPDKLRAESEFEVTVSESEKEDMTYTIAIVDEGLLDLTNFKTPDPWNYFYAREALGVKTWDMYDWVIGAHGSKLEHLLSIGGGGALNKESARKANRFEPVVKFLGPFYLRGGSSRTHNIKLPRYVGSVRTMVVAGNTDGAYGNAEKTTPVSKPLMVLGDLPRVLGPGESLDLPVNVFAMEDKVKNVSLSIKTNDKLIPAAGTDKMLRFDKPGEKTVYFPLKVSDKTGVATVEILASSGSETSTYSMEIDVRHPNPLMTDVIPASVKGGEQWKHTFERFGLPSTASASLEVYAIPPLNLEKRLKYLMNYPHGCLEQVVSAAFPQLYLDEFVNITPAQKNQTNNNINTAINKIRKYQMSNGGFSYWPGGNNTNHWATNYAGHFLLEAKEKGFDVPDVVLTNWVKYQREKALKWTDDGKISQFVQAYRLYTLSLAGKSRLSAMNRLRQTENLSEKASWRLAAAYEISGKHRIAVELIENLSLEVNPYFYGATFGSSVRDEAMILETLALMKSEQDAFKVLRSVSNELGEDSWLSTQTTAYSLIAAATYLDKFDVSNEIQAEYQINNGDKTSINSENPVVQMPLTGITASDNVLSFDNQTDGMLFLRLVQEGVPETGSETASENKINMQVRYYYPNGSKLNPAKIVQGTDFVCEVNISHNSFESVFKELALTQIFPSGWEIINSRLFSTELGDVSASEYLDIRDNKIYTYFDLYKGKTKTYRVMLNASYAGRFYMPGFNTEAMYDNSVHARNKGQWVEVVKPQ